VANYSNTKVAVETLSASVVDTVILTAPGGAIRVTNVSGGAPLYFTVSEPGGPCPIPTINGQSCYAVGNSAGDKLDVRHPGLYGSIVQVISSASVQYQVSVQSGKVNV
jgi:hypothetical protein